MNSFKQRMKNIVNPEIEKEIMSGNPYTICNLLEKTKGGLNGIYLKKLENAIIENGDLYHIYEFMFLAVDMNVLGFDRARFEAIIRESDNPKLMCYCMEFVPGTNRELMLEALINMKNAKYLEMLATNEEYSDVYEEIKEIKPQFNEILDEAKDFDYYPESLCKFIYLRDNIPELKEVIIESRNPVLITELANYIEYLNKYKDMDIDISDLTLAQEELKDPMQLYEYLASVNVENKTGLIQAIINSGEVKFIYYVYEYVEGLTQEEKNLLKESIETKDFDGKYKNMINGTNLADTQKGIGE